MFDRVVITGAGGMLAQALAVALERRGIAPVRLDRAALDIADEQAVSRTFHEHRPTLLLNCAAHTKVDLCEDEPERAGAINGQAVGTLAKLARQGGTFLVHYSTDFVFDGRANRPYREDDAVHPISEYGRSKLLGERQLQEHAAPGQWLLIRTAWVYGPGGANFPRVIVERARAGQALRVVNDETGAPTLTTDLAAATLDLLDRSASGLFHVTNAGQVNRYDYARAILEEFGLNADLTPITTAEWLQLRPKQARRPAYSVLDLSKFEQMTGRPMRPWRAALSDFRKQIEARGSWQ
jgi:dTDP-4-dehydrorhamnose reductase